MALIFLKTCHFGSARLVRWMLAIQNYEILIEHCPGIENLVADILSRVQPNKEWEKATKEKIVKIHNPVKLREKSSAGKKKIGRRQKETRGGK